MYRRIFDVVMNSNKQTGPLWRIHPKTLMLNDLHILLGPENKIQTENLVLKNVH